MRSLVISTTLAAFSLAAVAVPSAAQDQVRMAQVEHADLNIATEKGMETLQHRVRAAVRRICLRAEYGPVSRKLRS